MVTFGDALTLLLTFFVLLMTFSTSKTSKEGELKKMARGFLGQEGGSGPRPFEMKSATGVERENLRQARPDIRQSQFPPVYEKLQKKKLQEKVAGLTVSEDTSINKAIFIKVPVDTLFGPEGRLSSSGRDVLAEIREVMAPFRRTVLVRTRLNKEKQSQHSRSLACSHTVAAALRRSENGNALDFRVSPNFHLGRPDLRPGYCRIAILCE
jgi:flagellar motor protein MotB